MGITHSGLWSDATAHETIRLTPWRLVSRERFLGAEIDQALEPSQEECEHLILRPRPDSVTTEEQACLSEVALFHLSTDEPEPTEVGGLREGASAACAAASTGVSLSESED